MESEIPSAYPVSRELDKLPPLQDPESESGSAASGFIGVGAPRDLPIASHLSQC